MGSIPIVGSVGRGEMGDGPAEPRLGSGGWAPNPGGYPSGQRGLTVNQLADAFGGSNPSPPTQQPSAVSGQPSAGRLVMSWKYDDGRPLPGSALRGQRRGRWGLRAES